MTLKEAIELVALWREWGVEALPDRVMEAIMLLHQAGKHILNLREDGIIDPKSLLPGETIE